LADPAYEALNGMFGGWTAGVALAAVQAACDTGQTASALTVNYIARVEPGGEIRIRTTRVGGGRSVSHWQVHVHRVADGAVAATAMAAFANRRPTDGHEQVVMPVVPDPDELPEFHPPDPAGERSVIRSVSGHPPFGRGDTRSLAWIREVSGRRVDRVQLAFLADQCAPRAFFWSDGLRPSATLSMTVYFLATDEEIAAVGDDYVLHEAAGSRGVASIADHRSRLWSRSGCLLATTTQICSYR